MARHCSSFLQLIEKTTLCYNLHDCTQGRKCGGMWGGGWFTPQEAMASRSKNAYNWSQNKYYAIEGLHAAERRSTTYSGAASSISGGAIFIYSCSGQLSSFEIDLISKELNCPEHEYMNMAPPLIELAAPLTTYLETDISNATNGINKITFNSGMHA